MAEKDNSLFDLSSYPIEEKALKLKGLDAPVWTENKAALIQRYLRYFVFITKHGTYLDAFAGPQEPDHPESWAANLVLGSEPKWMRNFVLFELNKQSVRHLEKLVASQGEIKPKRSIQLISGDMNANLPKFLSENPIKASEATFCLLDQRTFECDWSTVETLARHKADGNKIELFYFLAQGWLDRAVAALGDRDKQMLKWWGNSDWSQFMKVHASERGIALAERFRKEFRYRFAFSYPIYERDGKGGKIMFWMIHASDHPEAPKLMVRAYNNAVAPLEPMEQLMLELGNCQDGSTALTNP